MTQIDIRPSRRRNSVVSRTGRRLRRVITISGLALAIVAADGLEYCDRAQATTSVQATINVSATVLSLCTVTAAPLAFGNYSSSAASTATTTVSVQCTYGTPYNVGLNQGSGSGATTTTRIMTGPSSATLNYGLYSDAGYSTLWGNVIGTSTVAGNGSGVLQPLTVYGKIPSGQYSAPGAYTDAVTVTLTY